MDVSQVESESTIIDRSHLPESILLVEDDRAHAQLIARALRGLAVKVNHVCTVSEALEVLAEQDVDMVLTDLNLVSCSGFDLLKEASQYLNYMPFIVLTSSANLDDAVRSMREGAWDYLTKQFSSNFSAHLELVLSRNWKRALRRHKEYETQAERNAFWIASSLADDGLAILDTGGRILYKNQSFDSFLSALGASKSAEGSDLVGLVANHNFRLSQDLFSQIHVSDDSLWRSEITAQNGDETAHFELRLSTILDKKTSALPEDVAALVAADQGVRYHVLWAKDVTAIRKSEQFERDLLATTTHDLKGPLGAILTSTEMLLEETSEDFVKDLILRVSSCARTCVSLVDELLTSRRIKDGIMTVTRSWVNICNPIEEVFYDFESVAKSKDISFHIIGVDREIKAYVDELAIRRVIGNLISNALKFTPKGGDVSVELEGGSKGVTIRVSDTGKGISPEKQAKLFDMFGRLPEHEKIEGTGLGLYITKKLVEMHQGTLQVKSTVDVGTTFSVFIDVPDVESD